MKKCITLLSLLTSLTSLCQTVKVEAESFVQQNGLQLVNITDEGKTGQALGYWNAGDFFSFRVTTARDGLYRFVVRTGTNISGASYEFRNEDGSVLAKLSPPNTGSHGVFTNAEVLVPLKRGTQLLWYVSVGDNAGSDVNWISYAFSHEEGAPQLQLTADTTIILTAGQRMSEAELNVRSDLGGKAEWKRVKGKGFVKNVTGMKAKVTDLAPGENIFEVTVTAPNGKKTSSRVSVIVKGCDGKKILLAPVDGSGSGLTLQVEGYDKREIYYPESAYKPGWNFPKIKVAPGDTLALRSQFHWSFIDLFGVEGVKGCPVVITSDSGVVRIDRGIRLLDARYVKVTGRSKTEKLSSYPTGKEKFLLDVKGVDAINGKKGFGYGGIAVEILGRSAHIEVDMVRAERKGYGITAKQDPACNPAYNYPNFIMDDIEIHHCYFEQVNQDVLYLGNTDPLGTRPLNCPTGTASTKPMRLSNFNVHHNRILLAGRTGIQLGGAETGRNQIHHNYISDCGYEFNQQQGTGISIGGMSRNTEVYDNIIRRTFLYGIFDLGTDSCYIYNNLVDSSGYLDIARMYPGMNVDSLSSALGVVQAKGSFILNRYQNGITNIQSTTKDTYPRYTKTAFYLNNVLGVNTSKADAEGIISFSEWGPAIDWSENSVVCGNTKINGQPATIETFRHKSQKWPKFSENCNDSPFNKPGTKKKKGSAPSKKISYKMVAGGVFSVALLAGIYLAYRRRAAR